VKAHTWQVTAKNGTQVVLFAEGEFSETSRILKSGFRDAEEVRYRGEQDMPTFRGRPKTVTEDDNEVTTASKHTGGLVAKKKAPLTGSARQKLLKQLAAARKVRMQNLGG
jgi:hypothetical protein